MKWVTSCPTLPSPRVYSADFSPSVVYNPLTPSSLQDNTYGPSYLAFHEGSAFVSGFILSIDAISYGKDTLFFSTGAPILPTILFFGYFSLM